MLAIARPWSTSRKLSPVISASISVAAASNASCVHQRLIRGYAPPPRRRGAAQTIAASSSATVAQAHHLLRHSASGGGMAPVWRLATGAPMGAIRHGGLRSGRCGRAGRSARLNLAGPRKPARWCQGDQPGHVTSGTGRSPLRRAEPAKLRDDRLLRSPGIQYPQRHSLGPAHLRQHRAAPSGSASKQRGESPHQRLPRRRHRHRLVGCPAIEPGGPLTRFHRR